MNLRILLRHLRQYEFKDIIVYFSTFIEGTNTIIIYILEDDK